MSEAPAGRPATRMPRSEEESEKETERAGDTPVPEAFVFDLGNVLISWDRERPFRELLPDPDERQRFFTEILPMQWNLDLDAGRDWDEAIAERQRAHPEYAEAIAAYRDRWSEMMGPEDTAMVGLLDRLRRAGHRIFALTNWSAETFPRAEAAFDWIGWFDGLVVSGHEGITKPDPEIYLLLADRHGLVPERTWFTDDSERNVRTALNLGFQGVVFEGYRSVLEDLRSRGVAI